MSVLQSCHGRISEFPGRGEGVLPSGSRDGAVVRALASHQCGLCLIPGLGVICGLSLLLVLIFALRGFSLGTPVFPFSSKTNASKFQFDLESVAN